MSWQHLLVVAFGGALGACSRYLISAAFALSTNELPWYTIIVNVAGSFAAGLLLMVFTARLAPTALLRLFIFTGFLGAFTTFSAFSAENLFYFQHHQWLKLIANILINNMGAFVGVVAGAYCAQFLIRGTAC